MFGKVSVNQLGGLALIVGPVLALVFYFLTPGQLIDSADPGNAAETIGALTGNSELTHLTSFLVPLGLLTFLSGIIGLQNILKGGDGDALSGYALRFITFGIIGFVVTSALQHTIAGDLGAAAGPVYAVAQGINLTSALVFSFGILGLGLAIASRDDFNKNFGYIAAVAAIVSGVFLVIGICDTSQVETASLVGGICYLIWTLWFITLGLTVLKKG